MKEAERKAAREREWEIEKERKRVEEKKRERETSVLNKYILNEDNIRQTWHLLQLLSLSMCVLVFISRFIFSVLSARNFALSKNFANG